MTKTRKTSLQGLQRGIRVILGGISIPSKSYCRHGGGVFHHPSSPFRFAHEVIRIAGFGQSDREKGLVLGAWRILRLRTPLFLPTPLPCHY